MATDEVLVNQREILSNQKTILDNQNKLSKVIANQASILANQQSILANQAKLDKLAADVAGVLANQETIQENQTAILHIFSERGDGGDAVFRCQVRDLLALFKEDTVKRYDNRAATLLRHEDERRVDFTQILRLCRCHGDARSLRGRLDVLQYGGVAWIRRIQQYGHALEVRHDAQQHLQEFGADVCSEVREAGDISFGP